MVKKKILGTVTITVSIISFILSFAIMSRVGETDFFGVAGLIRFFWIPLCFVPINIGLIALCKAFKDLELLYKSAMIICIIIILLLVLFGAYRYIKHDRFSYDSKTIESIQEKISFELPKAMKIANVIDENYIDSRMIIDDTEKEKLLIKIKNSDKWTQIKDNKLEELLPTGIWAMVSDYDYFLYYDESLGTFDIDASKEGNKCVFIAFEYETGKLVMLEQG